MPKFTKYVPSERQPETSRRPTGGTWVWSAGNNRGKSGMGELRWKRITTNPATSQEAAVDSPPAAAPPTSKAVAGARAGSPKPPEPAVPTKPEQPEVETTVVKEFWPSKGKRGQQKWRVAEVQDVTCPAGHVLKQISLTLPFICSQCGDEFDKGQVMWDCRKCDFDMCTTCRKAALAKPKTASQATALSLAKGLESPSMSSAESTQENGSSSSGTFEIDVPNASLSGGDDCWLGEATCDTWSEATRLALPDSSASDVSAACAEGEWYDVYYPPEGLSVVGQIEGVDPDSMACCSPSSSSEAQHAVSSTNPGPVRTSADAEIASMVAYMSKIALERYPSRCRLFELVQEAATEVLGEHFGRFALIGSTALGIDTPDSDLDAVVFTQPGESDGNNSSRAPRGAVDTLRGIRSMLAERDGTLQLQLVDCTRVPVLTVVTSDELSLDLTVDEPLGERHVLWFRSQAAAGFPVESDAPTPLYKVPEPSPDAWAQGLEAAVLRCVKWWLRRRAIPVAKEGGYPSVVWTLMVLHVLRCSVFLNSMDNGENRGRSVLTAMVAFFERFAESGLVGTFRFSGGRGAECWQQHVEDGSWPSMPVTELSVLDPTTTCEANGAWGQPLELAPRLSAATQLLHTHELRRAHILSTTAMFSTDLPSEHDSWSCSGSATLQHLFLEAGNTNVLPATLPGEPTGVLVLSDGQLTFGVLHDVKPKPGWGAAFLHRRDAQSRFSLQVCDVDYSTGVASERHDLHLSWFRPCDFVCVLPLRAGAQVSGSYELDAESLQRLCDMRMLVYGDVMHRNSGTARVGGGRSGGRRRNCKNQARA